MNKKHILLSVFILFICLITTGCDKYNEASPDKFKRTLSQNGYVVQEVNNSDSTITKQLIATSNDRTITMTYFETKRPERQTTDSSGKTNPSIDYAATLYNNYKTLIDTKKVNNSVVSDISDSNLTSYTIDNGGELYSISKIGNTIIYVVSNGGRSVEVNNTLTELGYK